MRCIIKSPGRKEKECEVENSLSVFQNIVGGYIEFIHLSDGIIIILNEEGKIREGFSENFELRGDTVFGPVIFAGSAFENIRSLTDGEILEVKSFLREKGKEKKKPFGETGNVYLTESEYSKLIKRFGLERVTLYIDKVGNYMGRSGKKYKSCYLAVISFIRSDEEKGLYIFGEGKVAKKSKFNNFTQKRINYEEIENRAMLKLMERRGRK